jgi:hypothetical protein
MKHTAIIRLNLKDLLDVLTPIFKNHGMEVDTIEMGRINPNTGEMVERYSGKLCPTNQGAATYYVIDIVGSKENSSIGTTVGKAIEDVARKIDLEM